MRVVHIASGAISGAPARLAQVQRQTGCEARVIACRHEPGPREFPHDVLLDADTDLIADLLRAAHVIHYHNDWRENELFKQHPWAWQLAKKKPSLIQFHSPRFARFEESLREPSLLKLVIAQFHVRLYPECRAVPNVVPIDDPLHQPLDRHNDPPIVAFTPSTCQPDGWRNKGCPETLPVLERGFRHLVRQGVTWREAMQARQQCDIAIDEIITGSYHMCSLESLSQGLATVARLDDLTVDALEMITGTRSHPWITATADTLHDRLSDLVHDEPYRLAKRREARAYMERHWHPRVIGETFLGLYREAAERQAG